MAEKQRIPTDGASAPLAHHPFGGLAPEAFPAAGGRLPVASAAPAQTAPSSKRKQPNRDRGRVDVVRQTAGRGGKTVTVLSGFKGIAAAELQELARTIQRACGVGGTLKSGAIEIQGDQRDRACAALEAAGFRPVRAGG